MSRSKTSMVKLEVGELYLNPSNDRYIEPVANEEEAIIAIFNVPNGNPEKEMYNLSNDIAQNGLNPFEFPIVWYNEEIGKYIVIEGNRRITCIKLMTQYRENNELVEKKSIIQSIYKLNMYNEFDGAVECIQYEDLEEAKKVLAKIHQDINDGIGRKGWDAYAKENNKASLGNSTRAYKIQEFIINYTKDNQIDTNLIELMNTTKWISKLQRVVSFAKFQEEYNIEFLRDNTFTFYDTEDQLYIMLSHLILDLINNKASGNFRTRDEFEAYLNSLDPKYKSLVQKEINQVDKDDIKNVNENTECLTDQDSHANGDGNKTQKKEYLEPTKPRENKRTNLGQNRALRLSKEYLDNEYNIFGEKGKQILMELESLDFQRYPYSAAALARSILEYVILKWSEDCQFKFDSNNLETCHKFCIDTLRTNNLLDNKEHSSLSRSVSKAKYIDDLNSWIHGNDLLCVDLTRLLDGWKINRILIEKYLRKKTL